MKKFGLGKKGADGDEDHNRSALFGSRSKSKSPAPPSSNPYAQPTAPPDPYTQAKIKAGVASPPPNAEYGLPSRPAIGLPSSPSPRGGRGYGGMNGPSPGPGGPGGQGYGADNKYGPSRGGYGGGNYGDDRYGSQDGRGGEKYGGDRYDNQGGSGAEKYGVDRYGNQGGYGADKYGGDRYGGGQATSTGSRYGPGGYGGLGRTNSNDTTTTDNRDALFGGAKERVQQKQQQSFGHPPPYEENVDGQSGAYGDSGNQGYGAYQDRQLTAEEEEEEDISATKQEIRFMKQQDRSSTRNALRAASQAEETGRNTLARLGAQGERIHNTEKNLDLAKNQNRTAEEKARELKTLNKSMFAVHVSNPFIGAERRRQRDEDIINKHREERDQREQTRQAAFETGQRMDRTFRDMQSQQQTAKGKASLAERAKYQFEADSEDDEMENELDSNIDALSGAAGRLNALARATGQEVEQQNAHLDRIGVKVSLSIRYHFGLSSLLTPIYRATLWTTRFT